MQGRRDRPAKVLGRVLTIPPDQTSGQMQHHVDIEGAAEPQTMPRGEGYFDLADTADADRFRCRRHFARLDLDRQECSYPPTGTKLRIAAPEKHHVRVQPMPTRHRRH